MDELSDIMTVFTIEFLLLKTFYKERFKQTLR